MTKDTFEYSDWPSRKPSKKKLQREALKRDPLGTTGQIVQTALKKSAERTVEREGGKVLRGVTRSGAAVAAASAVRSGAAAAAPLVAAAALVGGALYAMGRIGQMYNVSLGEKANRLSREFVAGQQAIMRQLRVNRWDDVPADIRNKLLNGYKAAIGKLYSGVRPGVFTPSTQIPYGR